MADHGEADGVELLTVVAVWVEKRVFQIIMAIRVEI